MSNPRYPEEFKIQAVNQVTEKSCLSLMWRRVLACRRIASMPG
ncbi:transposase-like protein [Pseudomonas silensiensis]|nr:transposase-like protein [Pseudomonas silensiensis]